MTYDVLGRPATATSPYGAVTYYTYSSTNVNLIVTTTGTRIVKTTLDGLGRTIKVETGDSNGTQSVVDTQYDSCACSPLGKVKQVSQPYTPGNTVYWTVYGYDALGRTTTITLPDGSVSSYSYSGNTTTVTDPAGKWKTYTTDAMGNLIQVTEPAPEGGTHLTTYAYNLYNQLTTVTMPRSTGTQTRTFNYDLPTAHLTSVTNPESGTATFAYNPDGTLLSKTDAIGQKIQFTYDTYGRVTVKQTYKSDGTEDLCGKATNYWDTRPSGVGSSGWENVSGRLMAVRWSASSCPGGQFTEGYQYDTGLLTIKRLYTPTLGSNSYIDGSYTYTDQGQLQSMAYPVWHGSGTQWPAAGKTFTYSLDTLSRPVGLTDELQTAWVSGVKYGTHDGIIGPAGQMTTMIYGGYTENFTYNARGQLTNLTATGNGLVSVNLQYNFSAAPNNDGRLMQMEDWAANPFEETNYLYDSLGRLIDAHTTGPQWGQTFSYDGFGNLTDETRVPTKNAGPTVHRTYDPATNRLTGTGYAYDANGNMTAMPGLTMTYNVENRMTQAVNTNFNETDNYGYDAVGLRLWKQGPDGVTHVFYNGLDGKPLADFYYSTQDQQVEGGTPMVYFAGKRVDNGSVEDRLGTAVLEGGTNRMAYFPYGELRSGTSTEVQFATYKRDSVTNLDYANHRYFSSQIARFTVPDPSGSASVEAPQSFNQYAYAGGDPVNRSDPTGLATDFLLDGVEFAVRENDGGGGGVGGLISVNNSTLICSGPGGDQSCYYLDTTTYVFQVSSDTQPTKPGTQVPTPPVPKPVVSPQTKQVQAALANLRKAIDPDCLSWLESGIAGGNVNIFNQYYALLMQTIGTADFSGTQYQSQNAVTGAPEYSSPITVNTEGAFFTSWDKGVGFGPDKILSMQPATGTAQFFVLLHELGHYFQASDYIQDDRGVGRQGQNNKLILEHCSKTLFPGAL